MCKTLEQWWCYVSWLAKLKEPSIQLEKRKKSTTLFISNLRMEVSLRVILPFRAYVIFLDCYRWKTPNSPVVESPFYTRIMEQVVGILLLFFNGIFTILLHCRCNYLGGSGIELSSLYMSKIQIELDCETQFCLEINFNLLLRSKPRYRSSQAINDSSTILNTHTMNIVLSFNISNNPKTCMDRTTKI